MESWRRAPTRVSGPGLVMALDRASDLAGLGVRVVDCSGVPPNRVAALASYLDAALGGLRAHSHPVRERDVVRLSPLGHAHLNELGRYRFPVLAPGTGCGRCATPTSTTTSETGHQTSNTGRG